MKRRPRCRTQSTSTSRTEGRVLINAEMSGFGGEAEFLCSTDAWTRSARLT